MMIPTAKLLLDMSAFDNNWYEDIMPLVESMRKDGYWQHALGINTVMPVGDYFLVVNGRRKVRAAMMLGIKEVPCEVVPYDPVEILSLQWKSTCYKPGFKPGRNYHPLREGY